MYNGASTSQDILTLTDDQYSEIPANIMKNWGADDFELTLEIKTTDGTDDIAADRLSGKFSEEYLRECYGSVDHSNKRP